MDNKIFKKRISAIFKNMGYNKNKKFYYKEYEEVYLKYNLQKSNFSNGWYINFDIVLKNLHCEKEALESWERDFSKRIVINKEGVVDLLELSDLEEKEWIFTEIERQIAAYDTIFEFADIGSYLKENPKCLLTASFEARKYLFQKGYIETV